MIFPKSKLIKFQTAYNIYEKSQIRALLDEAGIAYQVRGRGPGQYMQFLAGPNVYADDFYVTEDDLEKAQSLLEGFSFTDDEREITLFDDDSDEKDADKDKGKKD